MRETCLYCELQGRRTLLVFWAHWGFCPIHSAKEIKARGVCPWVPEVRK